ncbi:cupin domain-containing protein [Pelagicoccus mobilis]|uniref:Cupin domain-containing protein n=1 Tax=Pelagicoccus mobilis TaxID=415221 RepID=A0A934RWJ4_9BACT|nr:cupin domain-containing protein [Pelagicoccus mobilis]MBK1876795.1 cupin domain-containing protein [Pelagicoccus mobilis]
MDILHTKNATPSTAKQQLGPYQIESLIPEEQEASLTAYRVRIEANQVTAESYHKIAEECYYVLEGSGIAILDGKEHPLETGDFLRLPPGTRHKFTTGKQALVMLDLHTPGSRPNKDVYFTDKTPEGFTKNGSPSPPNLS